MNLRQRELARHALGLPNDQKQSYRNRFFLKPGSDDFQEWMDMIGSGLAGRIPSGEMFCFYLSGRGARRALDDGERLCPEDFPRASAEA